MTERPMVSVLVPVYNHASFIGITIKSVMDQTYPNWELLVVDDCSTDGSWEIICRFAKEDSRIRAFRNEKNKGLVDNWKFLIDHSEGDFLAFLEGDDFYYAENLEKKIDIFEKYPDLGMVYCNFDIVDENGGFLVRNHNAFQTVRTFKNSSIKPEEYLRARHHLINSYGQVMIKKRILERVGYPRTFDASEKVFLPSDWDFNFRVSTEFKVYFLNEVLFAYRKHRNNCSYDALKANGHISMVLDDYAQRFSDVPSVLDAIEYKRGRYAYYVVLHYLEHGKKSLAWSEFYRYMTKFKGNLLGDFNLNFKLMIRMVLPNFLNVYIRKKYYHN